MTHEAILVAHGSPADPFSQEAAMKALAVRVAMWLPGWRIRGATLAQAGALEAAVSQLTAPLIYPFFMAEGWFTRTNLPRRLAEAGGGALVQLLPFGTDPALIGLMASAAKRAAATNGILLAAHGSKVSKTSSETTYAMVESLLQLGFAPVKAGFVEEAPFLADVARELPNVTCLPFFALRAGHVVQDIPEALEAAGFQGQTLPPIGEDIGVAQLIAAALLRFEDHKSTP
ncbi:CbiX/SirB N-terminal domain-containing protein [Pseudorhodobacter ferrugineus]|uniref:CbiX/SirB N-terminal domain-containing protein n=1 Tax=Pseudorhodobacter ferrugineus TaxID=77008 RepID=UPI0003B425E5|nr:CbiX/SirB N-terminal domain-containing protein [Pseudorhodobacter ferrugineus]